MGNYSSFSRSPSPKKSWKCHLCLHADVEEQQTKGENEPVSAPLPTLPSLADSN